MKPTWIAIGLLMLGLSGHAHAQEPSGRLDLDVVSGSPFPRPVAFRVGFLDRDRDCPDHRQTLLIRNATLMQLELWMPGERRPASSWKAGMQPSDDETQLYRIATPSCRTEIAVRQQVRRDGAWASLLVPKTMRPSVPLEERRELERQFRENLHAQAQSAEARELVDRRADADRALHAAGSLSFSSFIKWPFPFAEPPQACFEAVGDYWIEPTGVRFSFVTGLPGDLNRFVIERADPDPDHARLSFTRADCRFELTIGQSVLRDDAWIPVPLAQAPSKR